MTDTEARETWSILSAGLLKSGLEEVLSRVEASLAEGKPEEREIEQFEEYSGKDANLIPAQDWRRRPGPRSHYLAHREYTQQERVLVLAEATLHAVVFSRQMEHDIWGYLEKSSRDEPGTVAIAAVRLIHDEPNRDRQIWSLQRQIPITELGKLQDLLEQIIKAARE